MHIKLVFVFLDHESHLVQETFRGLYKNFRFTDPQHDWPPFQPKQYVTLSLIHYKGEPTRREVIVVTEASRAGKIDHVDEIIRAQSATLQSEFVHERSITTKELEDIFKTMENSKVGMTSFHTMLIEGAPGIGKTVLSIEIAYQWAIGKLLQNTVLVIHLKLRDPAVQRMENVKEMLLYFYKHDESSVEMCSSYASFLIKNGGEGLAIIFDGYDELPKALREDSFLSNIISHKVLPKCTKVITSRPIASAGLHSKVSCRVEILGFTTSDRNEYIQNALQDSPNQIEALKSYLNSHPNINSLCYIPLNMTILLCLFKEKQQPPKSQTELYEKFILLTIFRHLKKEGIPVEDIKDLKCLPRKYTSIMCKLSLLAHKCLVEDKIVFQYSDIRNICPNFDKIPGALNGFGLLQAVQSFSFNEVKEEASLNFLHYSVQEFLAANYITSLNAFQLGVILRETFWVGKYFNMWIMYIGLSGGKALAFRHFLSGNRSLLYSWISRTDTLSRQLLLDKVKCFYLFHAAQEANNELLCNKIGDIFGDGVIDFSHTTLTPNNLQTLGYVIAKCSKAHWKRLSLHHANIGDTELQCFCNALKSADGNHAIIVDSIDLCYNHITSSCADSLVRLVQHFNATQLLISNNLHVIVGAVADLIKETTLRELDISCNNLGMGESIKLSEKTTIIEKLAEAIQVNVYLEIFNMGDNFISAKSVASSLVANCSIKKLSIANNLFKGAAVSLIASNGLVCLDLSNNYMDSTNVVNLFKSVKHASLTELVIAEDISFITEKEFLEIADSLAKAKTLNLLDINGCKVRQCDAYRFAVIISAFNPSLEIFVYNSCNLLTAKTIAYSSLVESNPICFNYQPFLPADIVELGNFLVQNFTTKQCPLLELFGCFKTDAGCVVLCNTFREDAKPNIKCIDLTDNCLTSSCIGLVIRIIRVCSTTKLYIGCNFLDSAAAASLINNTAVVEMDLSCNKLGSDIANHSTHSHTLQILNVSHNTLETGASSLISNTSLVEVNFSDNKLGLEGTCQLADVLKQNATIKSLDVSNNLIPSEGATALANVLAIHMTLKKLNISHNLIQDGAATLIRNTVITDLDVSHNNIGPACAIKCFKFIKHTSCLERLSLQGSTIDSAAADELAVLLATNTILTEINLTKCNVSQKRICNIAAMVCALDGALSDFRYDGKNLIRDNKVLEIKTNKLKLYAINGRRIISFNSLLPEDVAIISKRLLGARLIKLDLGFNRIKDVGCEIMLNTLNNHCVAFIQNIDLHNCGLTSSSVDLIVNLVKNCSTKELSVSKNSFCYAAAVLIKQTTLEQLDVSNNNVDNLGEHLISGTNNLKILNISYNSVAVDAGKLVSNTSLTELNLAHNSLSSEGFQKMSEALKYNKSIVSLNVSNNHISLANSLVMALAENNTLKKLDISKNLLKDGVVSLICNTKLVELDVSHNQVNTKTAIECFRAIKDNSYLKKFFLQDDMKITKKELNEFAVALIPNSTLEEIHIISNYVWDQRLSAVGDFINVVNNTLKVFRYDSRNLLSKSQRDIIERAKQKLLNRNGSPEDAAIVTKALIISTEQPKVLDISNCSIGNHGCELVHRILNTMTGVCIGSINLSSNHLTSESVYLVIQIVKQCKTTILSISHNSFAEAIATFINETELVELDASYNELHFNRKIIDEIVKATDKNISLKKLDLTKCGIDYFVTNNTNVSVTYS